MPLVRKETPHALYAFMPVFLTTCSENIVNCAKLMFLKDNLIAHYRFSS